MTVITKTSTTTTTYIVIKDHIAYEQALHIMPRVSFRVRFSRDFSQVTTPSNGEFAYGQKITALKFKVKLVKERNKTKVQCQVLALHAEVSVPSL